MAHVHNFTRLGSADCANLFGVAVARYRCSCGVWGVRRGTRIVAARCQKPLGSTRAHCGKDAVYVDGDRQHSRCAEHAPVETKIAS